MSIKHIRWLHAELEQWREEGLISEEQSRQLQAKYGGIPKEGPSWTRLVTVLGGASLILLGIILLFAGYWYGFSPNGRFDWALVILLLAITIVGGGVWKAKPASIIGEAITVIYMGILTTSTLLVADTYYTGEHMGLYVLIILCCSLPIIYILDSALGMILYLIGVLGWSFSNHPLNAWVGPAAVGGLLLLAVPYYIRRFGQYQQVKDPLLVSVSWAFVGAIFGEVFFTLSTYEPQMNLFFISVLGAVTYGLGTLEKKITLLALPCKGVGAIALLYTIVEGTYLSTWVRIGESSMAWWLWCCMLLSLGVAFLVLRRLVLGKRIESAIGLIPFAIFGCYMVTVSGSTPILTSILFNAYIFVAALGTFIRGTLVKKVSLLNSSILTLIAMFGARFFDPSFTFIERGVSFLVLGIIVLGINAIYLWRKGKQRATVNQRVRQARRQVADVSTLETQVVTQESKTVESEVTMKEEER
ncbi:DUF2157 domain-containing protein [Veillonella sp. VA139]|uniref:DUF2157 domain-containing protein n=1 Tax=Veillonella sp. VA139 TaxID=741830 RepID=UPI0013E048B2|nr:DUF2157 domain-containing protein [Veillonella sp. VA139]